MPERLGSIDIGSNAVRGFIGEILEKKKQLKVKKIERKRIPLRLAPDVLTTGNIPENLCLQLIEALQEFQAMFREYGVNNIKACATESLRIADNSKEVLQRAIDSTGLDLQVISGTEEAEIVFRHRIKQLAEPDKNILFADIGGGSTDIVLQKNNGQLLSGSFPLGTHRILTGTVPEDARANLQEFLLDNISSPLTWQFFGSGGNIRTLSKLSGKKKNVPLLYQELESFYKEMSSLSIAERMENWSLKQDRADVIVPALSIFLMILESCNKETVFVPKTNLNEGLVLELYHELQTG